MRHFLSNILKPFRTSSPTRARGARPGLEHLEDRTVPIVTYHGGPLLRSVGVESVFYGGNWSSNPALTQQAETLDDFLQDIVNSPYMDMLQNAGYGVGRGSFLNGIIDPVSLRRSVSDGQIENALAGLIASGGLQAPDANRLYVVFVQPGTEVFLPDGSNSHSDFLGYHGSFSGPTGAPVYYAVIPYPGGINASIPDLANPIDGMTNVTSHELGEAVTDPAGDRGRIGWYDDANDGEIGDLVEGDYGYLDGYVVQAQADRYDRPMLPSTAPPNPAPPTGTGGGQDVTSPTAWPGVSLGAYDPSAATWHLSTQNAQGVPDIAPFAYGAPGWSPVVGDWDGNGTVTVGAFDPATATWYLRNENSAGTPDAGVFRFGMPGWVPVVGDWGGTGHYGIGVIDPSTGTWYLRNEASPGAPDAGVFRYGAPGWVPVAGDWGGTGRFGIGMFDPGTGTWYLRNEASPGFADAGVFRYGAPGWVPVVGDWGGTGHSGVGVVDPATATWYVRYSASPGAPDLAPFAYGAAGWRPVAGIWSGPTGTSGLAAAANHTGDRLTQLGRTDTPDPAHTVPGLSRTQALDALFARGKLGHPSDNPDAF